MSLDNGLGRTKHAGDIQLDKKWYFVSELRDDPDTAAALLPAIRLIRSWRSPRIRSRVAAYRLVMLCWSAAKA